MKVEERLASMIEKLNQTLADAKKFDEGNVSAGSRVRKVMQEIKNDAQEVRVDVNEKRKSK